MSAGWWPIESAPDDGITEVDLWVVQPNDALENGCRMTDCACFDGDWRRGGTMRRIAPWRATHWRSIPSGPSRRRGPRKHVTEGNKCWCGPQVEDHGALVVIHNDG